MSRATDRDFEAFGVKLKDFVSVALSNSFKRTVHDLDREIAAKVKEVFYFPGDPSKLAVKHFTLKGAKISEASLSYKFQAVSLSKYPMKQVRISTGNSRIMVTRGAGAGNKFKTRGTPTYETYTQFKLRKSDPWRTVRGRLGYNTTSVKTGETRQNLGFLHTGQAGKFSSKVFQRKEAGRYPIHSLFGASLVRLLRSHEIQALLKDSLVLDKMQKDFSKSLSERKF